MSAEVSVEILEQNRRDLTTTRRIVGRAIARAMVSGDQFGQSMAWALAAALDGEGCEVEYPIRHGLKELGADYEQVWVEPPGWGSPKSPTVRMDTVRSEVAMHIAGAYVSGDDDQVRRARELETALDGAGLNVDSQVNRLVLEAMRRPPSSRGSARRADDCPF